MARFERGFTVEDPYWGWGYVLFCDHDRLVVKFCRRASTPVVYFDRIEYPIPPGDVPRDVPVLLSGLSAGMDEIPDFDDDPPWGDADLFDDFKANWGMPDYDNMGDRDDWY